MRLSILHYFADVFINLIDSDAEWNYVHDTKVYLIFCAHCDACIKYNWICCMLRKEFRIEPRMEIWVFSVALNLYSRKMAPVTVIGRKNWTASMFYILIFFYVTVIEPFVSHKAKPLGCGLIIFFLIPCSRCTNGVHVYFFWPGSSHFVQFGIPCHILFEPEFFQIAKM